MCMSTTGATGLVRDGFMLGGTPLQFQLPLPREYRWCKGLQPMNQQPCSLPTYTCVGCMEQGHDIHHCPTGLKVCRACRDPSHKRKQCPELWNAKQRWKYEQTQELLKRFAEDQPVEQEELTPTQEAVWENLSDDSKQNKTYAEACRSSIIHQYRQNKTARKRRRKNQQQRAAVRPPRNSVSRNSDNRTHNDTLELIFGSIRKIESVLEAKKTRKN